jgi:hypothetical protein
VLGGSITPRPLQIGFQLFFFGLPGCLLARELLVVAVLQTVVDDESSSRETHACGYKDAVSGFHSFLSVFD